MAKSKGKAKYVHLVDSPTPGRGFHTACGRDMAHVKHETQLIDLVTCPICKEKGVVR